MDNATGSMWNGRSVLALVLLTLAVGYFAVRGPYRAARGPTNDLRTLYGGAATWLAGGNPYDPQQISKMVIERGSDTPVTQPQITMPLLWVVMSPLGMLGWEAARWSWLVVNVAAVGGTVLLAARSAELDFRKPGHLCAVALLAALGPFQTSIAMGQVCVICGLLVLVAWLADRRDRSASAGLALAAAIALKPTMAGLFLVYWLFAGRWRAFAWGAGWTAVIAAAALGWMAANQVDWYPAWQQNMEVFLSSIGNPHQFNILIDLNFGLARFLDSDPLIDALTILLCSVPLVMLAIRARRTADTTGQWRDLGLVAAVSLLIVYHRFYDAVLLVFVWGWAVRMIIAGRRVGWVGVALLLPFLVNGTAVLGVLHRRGAIPEALWQTAAWQTLVVGHLTWTLAAMAVLLTWRSKRSDGDNGRSTRPANPPTSAGDP